MNKQDFILLLDELLELKPGTLTANTQLEGLGTWDSLAVVGFIALVDEKFDIVLSPPKIYNCQTVDDLVALVGDKITDLVKV